MNLSILWGKHGRPPHSNAPVFMFPLLSWLFGDKILPMQRLHSVVHLHMGVSSLSSIHYDKLVRDKIPEVIRQAGKQPVTGILPHEAMAAALDRKLQEEVQEYLESSSAEEMADILEVLHGIAYHKGISWDEVESVRIRKRDERGGFDKGIRLLEVREL